MSVKKQLQSFCKLFLFYGEKLEEFLDETDVDSYYYHNIFDISQSQHRKVRVRRGSNKKSFAIKLFQFCDLKTQQCYNLHEEVNISKRELTCLVDNLRDFLKTFDQASKCIQIPLPKAKVEIGSTKSKDNLFAHHYNDIIDHPNRQFRLPFRFGNNNSCVFSLKKFELHGNQFIPTEIVNLNHREIHHFTRTDITLQTSVKFLRAITMCSALTPDCGYNNSTFILIGDNYCPNKCVQVDFACTKRLFNHLAEAIINVRKVGLCARCAIFLLKIKKIPFSCRLVKGFTFLKRTQN